MCDSCRIRRIENPKGWTLRKAGSRLSKVRRAARRRPLVTAAVGVGAAGIVSVGLYWLLRRHFGLQSFWGPGTGYLVINGRRYPVAAPTNHSLQFTGLNPRTQPPTVGVLHVSEGEPADGSGVHDTLSQRELSVEFILDRQGTIWQTADPGRFYTSHAGSRLGPRSWGVEIVSYGVLEPGETVPARGRERELYDTVVNQRPYRMADLLPAQYASLSELTKVVNGVLGIPKQVLVDPPEVVPWEQLQHVRGLIAHYHSARRKSDPGPRVMERVSRQPGWRRTTV